MTTNNPSGGFLLWKRRGSQLVGGHRRQNRNGPQPVKLVLKARRTAKLAL